MRDILVFTPFGATLGPVVRVRNVLIEANGLSPKHLGKLHSTECKTFFTVSFEQYFLFIFIILSILM